MPVVALDVLHVSLSRTEPRGRQSRRWRRAPHHRFSYASPGAAPTAFRSLHTHALAKCADGSHSLNRARKGVAVLVDPVSAVLPGARSPSTSGTRARFGARFLRATARLWRSAPSPRPVGTRACGASLRNSPAARRSGGRPLLGTTHRREFPRGDLAPLLIDLRCRSRPRKCWSRRRRADHPAGLGLAAVAGPTIRSADRTRRHDSDDGWAKAHAGADREFW